MDGGDLDTENRDHSTADMEVVEESQYIQQELRAAKPPPLGEGMIDAYCTGLLRPGYNRRSSERKWPKRAKGTKGSQQNLEGHCWTRCVRISKAMRTHPIRGRHAQKAISAQMRTHSELLCVRISGSQHV
ncbi:hypothetical protein PIB30_033042 [Stylosanthes scabra]|uniref:Nuclear transcription factor Y subunit n=1 Tax=Stylosanthes scabra TaxID=79078 RepID=A0ABU6XB90_9FABA|nr:hypothetical protein [Stylosanthes scabra]